MKVNIKYFSRSLVKSLLFLNVPKKNSKELRNLSDIHLCSSPPACVVLVQFMLRDVAPWRSAAVLRREHVWVLIVNKQCCCYGDDCLMFPCFRSYSNATHLPQSWRWTRCHGFHDAGLQGKGRVSASWWERERSLRRPSCLLCHVTHEQEVNVNSGIDQ